VVDVKMEREKIAKTGECEKMVVNTKTKKETKIKKKLFGKKYKSYPKKSIHYEHDEIYTRRERKRKDKK
jgi:hypothetical protein